MGGIERYTDKLVHELKALGYEVVIVTTNHANLKEYEKNKTTVYRLPTYAIFKQRYPILKRDQHYKKLIKKINDENADYYICNTRFQLTTLLGARLAKKQGKEAIVIDHGSSHFSVGVPALDVLGKVYEHFLTSIVKLYVKKYYGVSLRCNEWLKHFRIKATGVFYNSIDTAAYQTYKTAPYKKDFGKQVVITYAGRVLKEKGVVLLLDVFVELAKRHEKICLVIAGDGPLLTELRKTYKHPRIYFEGKLGYDEVMPLLGRTNIFCHPSMYPEGLPTVILEAGLMKCAVIATDRGGTKEVINEDAYGMIIEENRESLLNALEALIEDHGTAEKMGQRLHTRVVKEFSWKSTAKCVQNELEELK